MRLLIIIALLLVGYDSLLHFTTFFVGRTNDGLPLVTLPWILFPTFPTWKTYDVIWGGIHIFAFATLTFAVYRRKA